MKRALLFALVFLCGCASIKDSWKEDKEQREFYKHKRAYHECVDVYRDRHAYEIMSCRRETREWNACESDHYDHHPLQKGVSCPETGPGFLIDQLYYAFFASDNECGYARDPEFQDGEPRIEDSCGARPPYVCEPWACEYPKNPRYDYGLPEASDGA